MKRVAVLVALALVGGAVSIGWFLVVPDLLRSEELITFDRPAVGEARPDYLPDGRPVWVIRHEDGSGSIVGGFDAHMPDGIGKLLVWCESKRVLENPHHGSFYDEYGRYLGGPATRSLSSSWATFEGDTLILGEARDTDAVPARIIPERRREACGMDSSPIYHTFDGWQLWTSPSAVVEAAPSGWVLVEGRLELDPEDLPVLCAVDTCDDSIRPTGVVHVPGQPLNEFGPYGYHDRYIGLVRDGTLTNLTRIVWDRPEEDAP